MRRQVKAVIVVLGLGLFVVAFFLVPVEPVAWVYPQLGSGIYNDAHVVQGLSSLSYRILNTGLVYTSGMPR